MVEKWGIDNQCIAKYECQKQCGRTEIYYNNQNLT